jgi:ATP-dependent Clp protease adapter protein ClpS
MSYDKNKFSECISNIIKDINCSSHCPSFYEVIITRDAERNNESQTLTYYLLSEVFNKDNLEIAKQINILSQTGEISLGKYTKDIAETKILCAKKCAFEGGETVNISIRRGEHNAIKKP